MKTFFTRLLLLASVMLAAAGLQAQGDEFKILFDVGFEDGRIPDDWEIMNERGDEDWKIVSGDSYGGSGRHVELRNGTSVQKNYKTLLVAPAVDVSTAYQPIVVFAHRQRQWTGDVDTLRVMYRTSADKEWTELGHFGNAVDEWKMDTLFLNDPGTTYQVAFLGSDNMGGGIELDNICVRSYPRCEQPSNFQVNNLSNDTCVISWYAGFEDINIKLKVSPIELTEEELDLSDGHEGLVIDTLLPAGSTELTLRGLTPGTDYWVYIRTICTNEQSDWSEGFTFSTTNLVSVPWLEDFNLPYTGLVSQELSGWSFGTSADILVPFINTSTLTSELHDFSRDNTTVLSFAGNNRTGDPIPGGQWAYAATPQMNVERIQDLQVTFEARFAYTQSDDGYRIILGVMSDPKNYGSFSPIDTFECINFREYYTFSALLDNYTGNGKYIALASDFTGTNQIFIDNFKVEYAGDCKAPVNVKVKVPSATELEITWDDNGAGKADIVLTKKFVSLSTNPKEEGDTVKVISGVPTGKPYTVTGLTPWEEYYVYVRNDNGAKSPWSIGVYRRMPQKMDGESLTFDFEITESDSSSWYNNLPYQDWGTSKMCLDLLSLYNGEGTNIVPEVSSTTKWEGHGPYHLHLTIANTDDYCAVIFPEIQDIREYRTRFYSNTLSTSIDEDKFVVGIMSDAADINTFYPLDTILPIGEDILHTIEFDKYPEEMNGKFFAIAMFIENNMHLKEQASGSSSAWAYGYIDDLIFEKIPECRAPYDVEVLTTTTTAELNWEKLADSYRIRVYTDTLSIEQLENEEFKFSYTNDNVSELPLKIEGLEAQQKEYYYYIQPVCGNRKGEWTTGVSFTTQCYDKHPLPYYQGFDGYDHSGAKEPQFVVPCMYTEMYYRNSQYYPYLYSSEGYYYNGDASLYLIAGTSSSYPDETYVAFPDMDTESISDLQITFALRCSYTDDTLSVGVMTDPNDITTFERVAKVTATEKSTFCEAVVRFDQYKGDGRYIALYMNPSSSFESFHIDSVVIEPLKCQKATELEVVNVTNNSAELNWTDGNPESWDIVVSTQPLGAEQLDKAAVGTDGVVFAKNVTEKPYTVTEGIKENTKYWFYVRGICSAEDKASWPFKAGEFRSGCGALDLGDNSVQTFDNDGTGVGAWPGCWVTGNPSVPASPSVAQQGYLPYCSDEYRHSGKASLRFYSSKSYDGAYAISPQLNVEDIRNVDVTFWASTTESRSNPEDYAAKIVVGVISSPYDLSTFVPLDTIQAYGDEQLFRVRMDEYKTDEGVEGGKYVMFLSEFGMNNYFYMDDIRFDETEACAVPVDVDTVELPTMNSVKVKWRGGSAPYTVVYSDRQLTEDELDGGEGTVAQSSVQTTEAEITGLDALTTYYVYVKSGCEGGGWSAPLRIRTECKDVYSLPFYDNFDHNQYAGNLPLCWYTSYSNTTYPNINATTAYKGMSVYLYSAKAAASYAVTPELDVEDITDCYVSFYVKSNVTTGLQRNIIVGLVSDVTDKDAITSSFVPVDTILVTANSFAKYAVPLKIADYTANGKHVGFYSSYDLNLTASGSATTGGVYLDEVEIDMFEPCPMPDFIAVNTVTDTELKGTFEEMGDATAWQAVYVESGKEVTTGTPVPLTAKEFAFTDLTPRTSYDIYVRAACAEGTDGYTKWRGPLTVSTTNVPAELPFTTGFEDGDEQNSGWDFASDAVNYWHIGNAAGHESPGGLYITDDGGTTAHYHITTEATSWAWRTIQLDAGEYTVEYDWTCFGQATSDFMRIGLLPTNVRFEGGYKNITYGDGSTFTMSGLAAGTPEEWISLEGTTATHTQLYKLSGSDTTSAENEWAHHTVKFTLEEGGIYNLVVLWTNNNSTGQHPTPSAVIDNLSVTCSSCMQPIDLRVTETSAEATTVAWDVRNSEATQWEVFLTNNADLYSPDEAAEGDEIRRDTVEAQSCTFERLEEWSRSYVFVRSLCSGDRRSLWSEKIEFRTDCSVKPLNTEFNFDDETELVEETEYGGNYDLHPMCFTLGHSQGMEVTTTNGQYYPYVRNSTTSMYAHSVQNSLYFYNTSAANAGGYIALPAFDTESLAGMQITFWMRPIYHNTVNKKMQTTGNLGTTYARSLTVGSMTDPYDFSTFKPIEVVTYPYTNTDITSQTLVTDDPNKTEWWREYTVVLPEDCGKYIVLWNGTDYGKTKNVMYVDDIKVGPVPDCATPTNVKASTVRSTTADIEFTPLNTEAGTRWVFHLSAKSDMTDTLLMDTVETADAYHLDKLTPNTEYFVRMKQLCIDGEESEWGATVSFRTTVAAPFLETFEKAVRVPDGWQRSNSCTAEDLFNGTDDLNNLDPSYTGWIRMGATAFASAHQYVNFSTSSSNVRWIITPTIDMGDKEGMKLTFDLAVTAENSNIAATDVFMNTQGMMFLVAISTDGGLTWKREDATIWNNTGDGDYKFSDLSNNPTKMEIDLSAYKGQAIKIAFHGASGKTTEDEGTHKGDIHIDNVRVNSLVNIPLVDDICEMNSYNRYGFSRHYDELSLGVHEMTRFALAADESKPDTIYDLTLSVNSLNRTYLTDSVCQGDVYDEYGFSTDMGGIQKQKFAFGDGRCDSVVYLDLKVIPVPTSVTTVTICQGQTYPWNGRELERSGEYTDTLQATSCDCDSVATLLLTVTDAEVTAIEETVCHDGSFDFGGRTLTESGVYRDTVTDESGCMAITELTLTVLPDYRRSYTAYFCAGTSYSDENFQGVTEEGTYTNPLTSTVGGCDSTVTITLIALGGDTVRVTDSITTEELPYTIDGTDITYEAGTEPGTYTDTVEISVSTEAGECSDVLIHTLVIDDVTAFNAAEVKELILTPNPVRVHESVMVHLELTPEEREGLTVQVFSSTGSLMRQFTPDGEPITIDGLDAAGVYMVRIVDGLGKVYTGKVIVR